MSLCVNFRYPYPGLEKMSRAEIFVACLASTGLMAGNAMVLKKLYSKFSKWRLVETPVLSGKSE